MRIRSCVLLGLAIVLMGADIPDSPPPQIQLDAAAESQLEAREIWSQLEASDGGGYHTAVIAVAAPPSVVMDAVMDLEARKGDSSALKEVELYGRSADPERLGAGYSVSVFGMSVVFHVLYDVDRASGWVRYSLDKSRENQMEEVEGSYQVYAHGTGSRLVYRGVSDSGRTLPGWVKRWLSTNSLTTQLQGIRDRAEAAARG